jgi:N-acyl-D-glutamate deacylase
VDPESNLDAARWVGINGQTISAISPEPLTGRTTIDAAGAIVVPGFIDLHAHGQAADVYALRASDGRRDSTGAGSRNRDVDRWYREATADS